MSGEEAFCLKWNDFQESISSALGPLLDCRELQDVTLQCGPLTSDTLQCHRLVLAACSDWFSNIFKSVHTSNISTIKHPVIVLWDTAVKDMKLLLDFMYNGVVNVKQENLNSFLALAERLSVRGLTQGQSQSRSQKNLDTGLSQSSPSRVKPSERSEGSVQQSEQDIQEVEEVAVVKEEQAKYDEGGEVVQFEGEGGYDVDYYEPEPGPAKDYDSPDTAGQFPLSQGGITVQLHNEEEDEDEDDEEEDVDFLINENTVSD